MIKWFSLCVWFHSDTYDSSLGDCITSYYVYLDYSWFILYDYYDLDNNKIGDKIVGDGMATCIELLLP